MSFSSLSLMKQFLMERYSRTRYIRKKKKKKKSTFGQNFVFHVPLQLSLQLHCSNLLHRAYYRKMYRTGSLATTDQVLLDHDPLL